MRTVVRTVVLAMLLMSPPALRAQWRVSVMPAAAGRLGEVTAVARQPDDSTTDDQRATSLVIRCTGRQLDGFITTQDQLESDMAGDIRVRILSDAMRARDSRWQATKSNTGAFIPPLELRDLIQRGILKSHAIRISAGTSNRGRVTWTFAVANFPPALDALREACPKERGAALAEPRP